MICIPGGDGHMRKRWQAYRHANMQLYIYRLQIYPLQISILTVNTLLWPLHCVVMGITCFYIIIAIILFVHYKLFHCIYFWIYFLTWHDMRWQLNILIILCSILIKEILLVMLFVNTITFWQNIMVNSQRNYFSILQKVSATFFNIILNIYCYITTCKPWQQKL